jgi:hypothetical protein
MPVGARFTSTTGFKGETRPAIEFIFQAPGGTRDWFNRLFNCPLVEFYGLALGAISMKI